MRISTEEMQNLHETLRSRALVDGLTGIANRAGVLEELDRMVVDAKGPISVMFMDLDGFKGVNDRYGHAAGDELLIAAAGRVRSRSRSSDVVGRLGGDEFLVLLPHDRDSHAGSQRIAEALAAPFQLSCGTVVISCSIGLVTGKVTDRTSADFVRAADDAMYKAKSAGKNHVVAVNLDERIAP